MVDSLALTNLKTTELPASDALTTSDLFLVVDPATGEPSRATGTQVATLLEAGALDPLTVTSTNASALAVGRQGATDPVLKVNASTASVATGVSITGAAAAGGVAVAAISSGTNESMTIDAKGSGTILLNGTATGAVNVGDNTNPAFSVVHTTEGTGLKVTSAAAASGVAVAAVSSGTDESLTIDAKGAGVVIVGGTSTGGISTGTDATDRVVIKGIYMSPANVAVTVPAIANDAAENGDSVAVDVSGAFSMAPAVGDAVIAIPQEALETDCLLCGAYVTATDQITLTFMSKEGGAGVTGGAKNFKFLVIDLT